MNTIIELDKKRGSGEGKYKMKMDYLCNLIEKPISGEWGDEGEKIPVIRSTNFTMDGILDLSDVKYRDIDDSKIAKKKLKRGDIIIEKSGGSLDQPVGRVVFFNEEGDFLFSNFTSVLRPISKKVYPKYLNYMLLSAYKGNITSYFQNRTTGIINLQLTRYVDELQIPLPPLPIQQKIAEALDKADAIRRRSKQILAKYDQLAQSVFLEMFGDPVKNEKGWEVKKLGEHISVQGGYAFKSTDYCNDGIRLIKISNVHFEVLNWSDDVNFVPSDYLKKHSNYSLYEGDILIALTRPIIKSLNTVKTAIVRSRDLPSLLNQRVARFNVDENRINKSFLISFLYTDHFKRLVENLMPVNLQPNISTGQIESMDLYLPPISLQNQFSSIISQIEKQKAQTQLELNRAEELYQSLLQRAFTGVLFPESSPKELTEA